MRLALALCLALATPLSAQDMTDAERAAFRAEVRAYLLDNPEVIMEAVAILQSREQAAAAANDEAMAQANARALFEDPNSYVGGNLNGDITVVEFMDYRCGYCKRAFPEVEQLVADDGNIRYIIKEFPILGEQSVLASQFAVAVKLMAGDELYKIAHNTLMEFRGDINQSNLTRLAGDLGLDADGVFETMRGTEVAAILEANRALGAALQISGTPTFVVDDQMLRGYVPLNQMQQIVSEIRG